MDELLAILTAYPTVIWTVFMGVCLVFWASVIAGAADFDLGAKAEGAVKGAVEGAAGAVKGGVDGAVKGGVEALKGGVEALKGVESIKGGVEGAVKGGVEALKGGVDVDHDAPSTSVITELLGMLRLDRAPITITASFFALFGWLTSAIGTSLLGGGWLVGSGVFAASAIVSVFLTSLAIRPLGVVFDEETRKGGHAIVGKTCVVRSGKVDAKGGQAEIEEPGASLVVDVRTHQPGVALPKGAHALVVDYDDADDCYVVEPLPAELADAPPARDEMISRPVAALDEAPVGDTVKIEKAKENA